MQTIEDFPRISVGRQLILTMRVPSAILSCNEVVGWDSSTPFHSPSAAAADEAAAAEEAALLDGAPARVRPLPWKAVYFGFSGSVQSSSFLTRLTSTGWLG